MTLVLLLGHSGFASAQTWDWQIAPSGGGFPTGISYDDGLLTFAVAGKVYLVRSQDGAVLGAPYDLTTLARRPVFARLFDLAAVEEHPFVFASAGSGWLYKFDAAAGLQVDQVGANLQSRDLRRGACPTDGLTAEPVVQRLADSNPGYTLARDIVMVGTAHACGDTTGNQVIALDANDVTLPPAWVFNSGEYEVGAIHSCLPDRARNRIYCGADVPAEASQFGIWAIDTNTGTLVWAGLLGSTVRALPALGLPGTPGDGHLYVGDDVGYLHVFDADDGTPIGDPLQVAAPPHAIGHDLAVGSGDHAGLVLAVADEGQLTAAYDAGSDLIVAWETSFAGGQYVITPAAPLASFGRLYIGTSDSRMCQHHFASGANEACAALGTPHLQTTIAAPTVYRAADGIHRVVVAHDNPASGTRILQYRVPCDYASPDCTFTDSIFADDFESGDLSAWDVATGGGDLGAAGAAALDGTTFGLRADVKSPGGLYVQDDSPDAEPRYRARFYFDPNGFDPGDRRGRRRTRIFTALQAAPARRLVSLVVRRQGGGYSLMARVRRDDGGATGTPFLPISDGPHAIEIDWRRATAPDAGDGGFALWIDGTLRSTLNGIDNGDGAIDSVRLGAVTARGGASGAAYWDEFVSRHQSYIGP